MSTTAYVGPSVLIVLAAIRYWPSGSRSRVSWTVCRSGSGESQTSSAGALVAATLARQSAAEP